MEDKCICMKLCDLLLSLDNVSAVVLLIGELGYGCDAPEYVILHPGDGDVLAAAETWWAGKSLNDAISYAQGDCNWLVEHSGDEDNHPGMPQENQPMWDFDKLITRWMEEDN